MYGYVDEVGALTYTFSPERKKGGDQPSGASRRMQGDIAAFRESIALKHVVQCFEMKT